MGGERKRGRGGGRAGGGREGGGRERERAREREWEREGERARAREGVREGERRETERGREYFISPSLHISTLFIGVVAFRQRRGGWGCSTLSACFVVYVSDLLGVEGGERIVVTVVVE